MNIDLIKNKRIAIIGGGPVGLTAARILQIRGADVKVFERDTSATARIKGGTLDLHKGTGQTAMEAAGLTHAFEKYGRPTGMKVGDMHGNIIFEMKPDPDKPEIDRPDLRKILLESLESDTVEWDRRVISVGEEKGVFQLLFHNGLAAEAEIVIIADGGMSKARKFISDTLPEETGTYVIQGEITHPERSCPEILRVIGENNLAAVEDKKAFFLQHRGDGSICFYVSFRKNEQWIKDTDLDFNNPSAVNQFLLELFRHWNPFYFEIFTACEEYACFPLRVFHASENLKPHGNITVVGDAAHVMPPFGGMGVNLGMKDALVLADNLTSGEFSDTKSAIADYEQKMITYTSDIQRETHAGDDRIHTQLANSFHRMKR